MSKPLRIDAEAHEELWAAISWYEQQRVGLGREFLAAVDRTYDQIDESPRTWPLAPGIPEHLGVRRQLVRRFPYAIYFLELRDETRVLAIAHDRRRPGYWRRRLEGS
jgi:toxin ParE1/3/4